MPINGVQSTPSKVITPSMCYVMIVMFPQGARQAWGTESRPAAEGVHKANAWPSARRSITLFWIELPGKWGAFYNYGADSAFLLC